MEGKLDLYKASIRDKTGATTYMDKTGVTT